MSRVNDMLSAQPFPWWSVFRLANQSQWLRTESRCHKTWILKNRDQRLAPNVAALFGQIARSSATETRLSRTNLRNSRPFCEETGAGQKRRHWSAGAPGFEPEMPFPKMPFD